MKSNQKVLSGVLLLLIIIALLSVLLFLILKPSQPWDKVSGSHTEETEWQLVGHLQGTGANSLKRPMQVIGFKDQLMVSDSGNGQVLVYSLKGKVLSRFGKEGSGKLIFPYDLVIDQDKILISDPDRGDIVMFSPDGRYLGTFPDPGDIIKRPAGLEVSGQKLYVTDLERHQVLVFDLQGKLLARWGSGKQGSTYQDLAYPNDVLAVGDKVYISDTGNNRVQVFNTAGQYVKTITHPEKGNLINNRGLALTPRGNLLVASSMTDKILLFSPDGEFKASFGGGNAPELNLHLPNGLTITNYRGENFLAIADKGNSRVCIYKLPREW